MAYDVETTDEFSAWYASLEDNVIKAVNAKIDMLVELGWRLSRPHADTLNGARHNNLKELRVNAQGRPIRIFFAFDPRQTAIILIGGDKSGDSRFYERMIPIADALYDTHLAEIEEERNA